MPAAYVKEIGKNSRTTSSNTLVITASATAGAGNLLVMRAVSGGGFIVSSIADSRSNTWAVDVAHATSPKACICSTLQNGGAIQSGDTITITFTGSGAVAIALVDEFSGIVASPLDKTVTGTTTGTARASGTTATLTQANELVIAAFGVPVAEAAFAKAAGFSDFNTPSMAASTTSMEGEFQVVSATTAISATATGTTTAAATSTGATATYKATAASSPSNSVAPAVTGTTAVGSVLSTTNGTWTDNGSPTFTYQWQRDAAGNLSFSNIGSATSSTYTLVNADDGNKVRCVVTDTDTSGAAAGTANSNAVGLIVETGVPAISVAPAVTGTTTVGQTLTSDTGTWTNQGGSVHTYAYQWQRDALGSGSYSNISSATSSTYVLVDADDSCHIKCLVTATNDVGAGSAAASNIVGTVIEPAPTNSVVPALGGTNATTGSAITVTTGTWANMAGAGSHSFTYQWRDCATSGGTYADIASATSSSYTVASGEATKFLKCVVTAHNTNGSTGSATTVASNQVAAGAASTASGPDPSKTASAVVILGL